MTSKNTTQKEQKNIFVEKAKSCKTDQQKIEFFNSSMEAFFIDSNGVVVGKKDNLPKDVDDAFYVYANMKKMNEIELEILKELNWSDFPENLKIFLFDFCILNGDAYSKFFID